jgi:hypothetical protein
MRIVKNMLLCGRPNILFTLNIFENHITRNSVNNFYSNWGKLSFINELLICKKVQYMPMVDIASLNYKYH